MKEHEYKKHVIFFMYIYIRIPCIYIYIIYIYMCFLDMCFQSIMFALGTGMPLCFEDSYQQSSRGPTILNVSKSKVKSLNFRK